MDSIPTEYLFEALIGCMVVLMGWLHMRQNKLEEKIEKCVPMTALDDVKKELQKVVDLLTEERVENAEWRGTLKKVLNRDSQNS